ncbi:MAG: hypothetical protein M0R66_02060 [Candidatus Omnitrophica bacterium]|nr:hypothetical protein [Candidatus Omnitrophota bacterium]
MDINPKTFNLKEALAGISYPEDTVTVFLDAKLMYEYSQAKREWDYDPANKKKEARVEELEKTFEGIALKVTVKDMPSRIRRDVVNKVRGEFPPEKNMFGMAIDTPEGQEELQLQLWALYITSITAPDGTVIVPDVEDIKLLRDEAPDIALDTIRKAIDGLTEITKSGYEQAVQAPGFLSQPSLTESPDSTTL